MSLSLIAFAVLIAAFAIGSFTRLNAGLIAIVAAFGVGTIVAGLSIKDVIAQFPSGLFFILVGATLLFAIVRINGTIDLLAYWAELLALHNALTLHHIDHAFACLTAGNLSDYVPDRPWLVTVQDQVESIEKVDRFRFDYKEPKTEPLEIMGESFKVNVTSPQDTALLLAATGLPRERIAAKQILERHPPRKDVAKRLNYFGVPTLRDVVESEDPRIRLPSFLEERRSRLGNELLRGGPP